MNEKLKTGVYATIGGTIAAVVLYLFKRDLEAAAGEPIPPGMENAIGVLCTFGLLVFSASFDAFRPILGALRDRAVRWAKGINAALILVAVLGASSQACVTVDDQRAVLIGLSGSIATTSAVIAEQCGNDYPKACVADSFISTELRDSMGRQLRRALDVVKVARVAVNIGASDQVSDAIVEATRILEIVRQALMREQLAKQGGADMSYLQRQRHRGEVKGEILFSAQGGAP